MKIQAISLTQSYNKKPTFKGAAERKIFMDAIDVLDLKTAMYDSLKIENKKPMEEYFSKIMKNLYQEFSKTYKNILKDGKDFVFETPNEMIFVKKVSYNDRCYLEYSEMSDLDKNFFKAERIQLAYTPKVDGYGQIAKFNTVFLKSKINGEGIEMGPTENLKSGSIHFEQGPFLKTTWPAIDKASN